MEKGGFLLAVAILLIVNIRLVSASTIKFDPLPPSTVCNSEAIDITVTGEVPLTMTQQAVCLISPPYHISFDLYLMEADIWPNPDDEIEEQWSGGYSYDCSKVYYTWTFEDIVPSNWAGGTEGSQIEMYAKVDPDDVSGSTSSNRNIDSLYNCECFSGSCCDMSSRPFNFKSSGSQPTDYIDYYFCDGDNSPTNISYSKKRDYYCDGDDSNMHHTDTTVDTCGTCEYCTSGDSTCNYYGSSTTCGTKDCDYLDTSCRDYDDVDKKCSSGSCISQDCDSYTDEPKHTYCGSEKECDGSGSCITCTSHSYSLCYSSDVYWYDACDNRQERKQDCGEDYCSSEWHYYCEGNNRMKLKWCWDKGCSDNECFSDLWYDDGYFVETCPEDCTDGSCEESVACYTDANCGLVTESNPYCKTNDVYAIKERTICFNPGNPSAFCDDQVTSQEIMKQDCGDDSYSANYCYDNDLYKDFMDRGCGTGTCFETTTKQKVEECGSKGCSNNKCNPSSCTDECSLGEKRCSGDYKQTCGNYDADVCLEFGGNVLCENGCENGECKARLNGDTNSDCKVDIFDLAKIGVCYNKPLAGCESADLNSDGSINIFDLATVGRYYGSIC